jgi:hypothetical protein
MVKAQLNGSLIDTLKSGYTISQQLDSTDLLLPIQSSTLPGGGLNATSSIFSAQIIIQSKGGQRFYAFSPWKKMRFSALPHLGFSYSFGNKGTQHLLAEYQHALSTKSLLNIDYNRYSSTGYLRNSEFTHNDLQIQYNFNAKRYQSDLKIGYQNSNVQQSGGITNDTLLQTLDLIYVPVNKTNAITKTQLGRINWNNYLDFNKDSLQSKGIFTQHKLSAKNYSYSESDTLSTIYSLINFDSLQTNDNHQLTQLENGFGVYSSNPFHELKIGLNTNYWQFKNLTSLNDTLEVSTFFNFKRERKTSFINNQFEINIIGAKNEFHNYFSAIKQLNHIQLNGTVSVESKLPAIYQRLAIGNNYNNLNGQYNKQFNFFSDLNASYATKLLTIKAGHRFSISNNNYFFKETKWEQDTINNFVLQQLYLNLDFKYKFISIQPKYTFSIVDQSTDFIPLHQFQGRIFIKGGIFKAKKLKGYLGADFSYNSSFRQVYFNALTSSFNFTTSTIQLQEQFNLHAFGGIQIEEFKFFVRVENIGRSWNEISSSPVSAFPIASMQFRVGITWDFFN